MPAPEATADVLLAAAAVSSDGYSRLEGVIPQRGVGELGDHLLLLLQQLLQRMLLHLKPAGSAHSTGVNRE